MFTDSGHEQWQYIFKKGQEDATNFIPVYDSLHRGDHAKQKTLTIIFNNDKVWHHSLNNSAIQASGGAF